MRMHAIAFATALLVGTAVASAQDDKERDRPAREGGPSAVDPGAGESGAGRPDRAEPRGGVDRGQAAEKERGGAGQAETRRSEDRRQAGEKSEPAEDKGREARDTKQDEPRESRKEKAVDTKPEREKAADQSKDASQKKADQDDKGDAKRRKDAADRNEADTQPAAKSDKRDTAKQADPASKDTADKNDETSKAKQVQLTPEKSTRVREAFRNVKDVRKSVDVDVNIRVGRRLPRDLYYQPIPTAVVEVVPEYRDYVFVFVEDRYVICDPETFEVVAFIDSGGRVVADDSAATGRATGTSGRGDECPTSLSLSKDQEELIFESVELGGAGDVGDISIGWQVPREIELRTFPDPVMTQIGSLRSCRYFVSDEQIVVVDPDDGKVVMLIEND